MAGKKKSKAKERASKGRWSEKEQDKMKNMNKFLLVGTLVSLTGLLAISMTNDTARTITRVDADATTLRIYNWEDYIYEPESEEDDASIIDQFINYYETKTGTTISVVYDTFSTNEEMYNTINFGAQYDLLVPEWIHGPTFN